jgi:hypothetical protein
MTKHWNISVSDELHELVEKERGELPLSIFVRKIMAKGLGVDQQQLTKVRKEMKKK